MPATMAAAQMTRRQLRGSPNTTTPMSSGEQHRCLAQGRDVGHGPLAEGVKDNGIGGDGKDAAGDIYFPSAAQEGADFARAHYCDADHERDALEDIEPDDVAPGRRGAAHAKAVDHRVDGDEERRGEGQEDCLEFAVPLGRPLANMRLMMPSNTSATPAMPAEFGASPANNAASTVTARGAVPRTKG